MSELNILGICGSLRASSRNMGLLRCAAASLPDGAKLTIADISDLPFYAEDREKPESALRLIEQARQADAFVLACPEYNYSMAPALKNALDWISREEDSPQAGKYAAIMGAGGGMGTSRAQYHLRQSCVYLDLRVLNKPEVFSNAFSAAFDENGNVADSPEGKKLSSNIRALMDALIAAARAQKA